MKYSILGFNQEKVVAYEKDGLKCDLTDLLLLNYIIYAQANPKMKHYTDSEMNPYVWLQHNHLLEDLPILNITDGTLKNRLTKLRKMELISSKTIANENSQGSRTYYRTTSLLYDMLFETTSFKNDVIEEPRHSKMTSNSKVNNDNKVKNNNSKELLLQNSPSFEFGKEKSTPKKESLYSKCTAMINDFTKDKQVISDLTIYLHILLEMRKDGYSLYTNVWKGLLRKLKELSDDPKEQHLIISQSVERGYKSFYPVNNWKSKEYDVTKGKSWEENVSCRQATPEELAEIERLNKEREAKGLRTKF